MTVQEWLGANNKTGSDIWSKKYKLTDKKGEESFDNWLDRVSGGNIELRNLIKDKLFLLGGRALANRNVENSGTYFNCYSLGYVEDDYKSIMQTAMDMGLTYKAQGGQGVSMSKIRPKNTPIGERYKSDGIIPFMKIFNSVTKETSQGGARKGALMISLDIRHKEAEDFIKIKSNLGIIEKANLSLEIDDEFMRAVKTYYDTGETITLNEKRDYGKHHIEYDIIPIKLYKLIAENSYDWGEPACLFTERFRNYNLMEFDDEYQIETSNPCGEQPLPKNFCCNLGSINLAEFVFNPFMGNAYFDTNLFENVVKKAVRSLDELIDENADKHPLENQKINSLNYRNIGLGVMGYANALMRLKLKYGSKEALTFTDELFNNMFKFAVKASIELASEKGTFPKYKECVFDSTIMKNHFSNKELKEFKNIGLRNCSLLSIAPTGTLSTMLNETGGIEPEFSIEYTRKTESLNNKEQIYTIICKSYQDYIDITNETEIIPDYFITSKDIFWKDRINTQAIIQKHIDTAISSTVNLKKDCSIDIIEQLYLYAWEKGLKGITVFRDGCKRGGILLDKNNEVESLTTPSYQLERGTIIDINDDVIGKKRKLITGCGSLHCLAFFDPNTGDLLETYLSKGSAGGCQNFMVGLSRMISLSARAGCDIKSIVNQLDSCGTCPSYSNRTVKHHDTSKGACCPMAIGKALIDMYNEILDELGVDIVEEIIPLTSSSAICPECGENLYHETGCTSCKFCGYSKCN